MKKSLLSYFVLKLLIFLFLFLFLSFKAVYADGGVGVHHYNLNDIEQIKREMAAGLPVTFWATPGDFNLINELNEYNKSLEKPVPMFIEDPWGLHDPGVRFLTLEERRQRNNAWVATLGQLEKSSAPPILMPSNEDFTWRCHTDESCFPETARILVESSIHMYNAMIEAGIGDKFILASPMLNITHPGYYPFVAEIQRLYAASDKKIPGITPSQYPELFGIWLLNEYVTINPDGSMYLQDWQSAWTYTGFGEMPKFDKELGARTEAGVTYDPMLVQKVILEFLLPHWLADPTHFGGTILNFEGLVTPKFLEFVQEISKLFEGKKGIFSGTLSPEDLEKYQKFLEEMLKNGDLVKCPKGGYAPTLEMCEEKAKSWKRGEHTCSTTQEAMVPTDLRPAPCDSCSDPLGPQTDSCGTPFQAYTNAEWCLDDVDRCDGDYTKSFDWGGKVKINFSQTKVPFAGYGDSTNPNINTKENPSTARYLADYFDGTFLYGGDPFVENVEDITENMMKKVFREGGIWRKLAPQEIQDVYKRNMIGRAHRSQQGTEFYPIANYTVKSPDPDKCEDKKLIDFITGLGKKPLRRSYPSAQEYETALRAWEQKDNGCWKTLWPAVPMFTREDGVGEISVTAHPPGKISPSKVRATFPHLPRLYETTQALQQMLFPKWPPHSIDLLSKKNSNLLASSETFSPTLLAQGEKPQLPFGLNFSAGLSPTDTRGQYRVNWQWGGYTTRDDVDFVHPTYQILVNGEVKTELHLQFHNFKDNPTLTQDMGGVGQVFITPGEGDVEISVRIVAGSPSGPGIEGDPRTYLSASQTCTVDENGNISGCGVGAPTISPITSPPSAVCESPDSKKACFDPKALTDDNPNDPICVANSTNGVLSTDLDVKGYRAKISSGEYNQVKAEYEKCMANCGDEPGEKPCSSCNQCSDVELSRWISIRTKIPWLNEIWKQTTALEQEGESIYDNGLFHIFTPASLQNWEEKQAKSPIASYNFAVGYGGDGGGVKTDSGWLYYPKLGGVQEAKKCLSEIMLLPKEVGNQQEAYELCPPFREK